MNKQQSRGKHQICAEIETTNCFEKYLDIENMNIRKSITKMRISSHKFPIEMGRYEGKDRDNRIKERRKQQISRKRRGKTITTTDREDKLGGNTEQT